MRKILIVGSFFLDGLPQVLNGIEIGRITGQLTTGEPLGMGVEKGLGTFAGVIPGSILDKGVASYLRCQFFDFDSRGFVEVPAPEGLPSIGLNQDS